MTFKHQIHLISCFNRRQLQNYKHD